MLATEDMRTGDWRDPKQAELTSRTISFIRFPMIVLVVLLHADFDNIIGQDNQLLDANAFALYRYTSQLVSGIIAQIAVPLFFLISGYLFFVKVYRFTPKEYLSKLSKRSRTLLVPYVLWNVITVMLFFMSQTFIPQLYSTAKPIVDYTALDWYYAFWGNPHNLNMPICFQFWFIRDLMVMVVLSPVVYFLVRRFRLCSLVLFGLLWLFYDMLSPVIGLSPVAFFFFSLGAFWGLDKCGFAALLIRPWRVLGVVFLSLSVVLLAVPESYLRGVLLKIDILVGIACFVGLSASSVSRGRWHIPAYVSSSAFFVYAYHGMVLAAVIKVLSKILPFDCPDMMLMYFVSPLFVIVLGVWLNRLLDKYTPRLAAALTGGRS